MAKGPDVFTTNMFESEEPLPPKPDPAEALVKRGLSSQEEVLRNEIIETLKQEYEQKGQSFSQSENEALINQRMGLARAEKLKTKATNPPTTNLDQTVDRKRIGGGDFGD